MLALMNKSLPAYENTAKALNNVTGAAEEMAAVMNRGLGASFEQLQGSVDTLFIQFGEQLAPVKNWAKDYVVGPTFFKASVDAKHMVFARDDDTAIVITRNDGVITNLTLNAGLRWEQQTGFVAAGDVDVFGQVALADPFEMPDGGADRADSRPREFPAVTVSALHSNRMRSTHAAENRSIPIARQKRPTRRTTMRRAARRTHHLRSETWSRNLDEHRTAVDGVTHRAPRTGRNTRSSRKLVIGNVIRQHHCGPARGSFRRFHEIQFDESR
jgi:hypothetical protein